MKRKTAAGTRAYRVEMNEKILAAGNREIGRFFAIDQDVYRDGALPARTKELLGLVASLVLRCDECVFYHLDRCVAEGVSREEMVEATSVALVVGGSIVIPHLRTAFEAMDELLAPAGTANRETTE